MILDQRQHLLLKSMVEHSTFLSGKTFINGIDTMRTGIARIVSRGAYTDDECKILNELRDEWVINRRKNAEMTKKFWEEFDKQQKL